jgi:putative ABC transport system permease protein
VAEVSLAMMLLLAAGLLVKSFNLLLEVNPGFRVDGLLTARIWLSNTKYPTPEARATFFRDLVERLGGMPGAQSASASTSIPMTGGGNGANFVVEGQPTPAAGHEPIGRIRSITPGYFQTIGIPLVRGRYFTGQDDAGAQRVVIINERMAQQFFAGQDPIGKRVKWNADPASKAPWMTIVGVAGNVKPLGLGSQPVVEMFAPSHQAPSPAMFILIRTQSADPSGLASAVRAELRNLDRDQPMNGVQSMKEIVESTLVESRYMTILTSIFASIALLMAAMGIYGVMSYTVAQRTRELGIRMALGAGSANVVRLVLRQALWVVGIGIAIGVPAAAAVTRVLQSYLYGVGPRDPATFILIPAVLAVVALVASYVPARRATRVDPMIALRYE